MEKISVTFTLIPSPIALVIAGRPSRVAGILTIRLGRSTVFTGPPPGPRGLRLVRQLGVHLEGDPSVDAAGAFPGGPEQVTGTLHVGHGGLAHRVGHRRARAARSRIWAE